MTHVNPFIQVTSLLQSDTCKAIQRICQPIQRGHVGPHIFCNCSSTLCTQLLKHPLPEIACLQTLLSQRQSLQAGNWCSKRNKRDESALWYDCVPYTHYKCCMVLAAHGLVQGSDAIFCSEVQMRSSTLQHLDELCTAFQLCCQRQRTFCKIKV